MFEITNLEQDLHAQKANKLRKLLQIKVLMEKIEEKYSSRWLKIECTHMQIKLQDFFTMCK